MVEADQSSYGIYGGPLFGLASFMWWCALNYTWGVSFLFLLYVVSLFVFHYMLTLRTMSISSVGEGLEKICLFSVFLFYVFYFLFLLFLFPYFVSIFVFVSILCFYLVIFFFVCFSISVCCFVFLLLFSILGFMFYCTCYVLLFYCFYI